DAYAGNAYAAEGKPRLPTSLHAALDLLDSSALAREAFGDDVVDHYLHYGRTEQAAFEAAITDWELIRGFERM
ncbi:MAG TPA: glutamine synthetase, partial [Gaiellales bacterium]|nr:glutamine synthetase [Gaiellales bacterium]